MCALIKLELKICFQGYNTEDTAFIFVVRLRDTIVHEGECRENLVRVGVSSHVVTWPRRRRHVSSAHPSDYPGCSGLDHSGGLSH